MFLNQNNTTKTKIPRSAGAMLVLGTLILALAGGFLVVKKLINKNKNNVFALNTFISISDKPWITISPNKRYFMFEDGKSFFPLGVSGGGEQINYDYFGTVKIENRAGDKLYTYDSKTVEKRFQDMRANKENFIRIDIEGLGWWDRKNIERLIADGKIQFLEDPAGVFNEEYAKRVDNFVNLAEKYGIYIDLVLMPHTCQLEGLRNNFDLHPYHVNKGGPAKSLTDFFYDNKTKEMYKKRMEYIVDRWGDSPNIFSWELWNELSGCGGSGSDKVNAAWVKEMGEHIKNYEKSKYGKTHLVNVSVTGNYMPPQQYVYDSPGTDIATVHYYTDISDKIPRPSDVPIQIAKAVPILLKDRIKYNRPHLENERYVGGFVETLTNQAENNASWAYLASGSAGAGATWVRFDRFVPDTGDRGRAPFVEKTHQIMNELIVNHSIDFANFNSRPYAKEIKSSNKEIFPTAVSDGRTMIGWMIHDNALDYTIDLINLFRAKYNNKNGLNPVSSTYIQEPPPTMDILVARLWYGLIKKQGVKIDLSPFLGQISDIIVNYSGVAKKKADELALKFIKGRVDIEKIKTFATPEQQSQIAADVRLIAEGLYDYFESIEKESQTLQNQYKGHPEVSTILTIKKLCRGNHQIYWYNDATGEKIKEEAVFGSTIKIKSPSFRKHAAFIIKSPDNCN